MSICEVMTVAAAAETFDEYVRRRSVTLQRFAYLVTRNVEDARDCVQDALLGLYPRWEEVSARGGVDAYVRRSIVNASVSRWRRNHGTVPTDVPEALAARGPAADPMARVDDADEAWRLLAELTPQQRAAVIMRFWEDRSFAQIAEVLDCAEASARSHVHRALTRLRTRLVEEV